MGSGRGWLAGDWPSTGGVRNITAAVWTAGFHWWRSGNKKRKQNVSEYMLVLALCLVVIVLIVSSSSSAAAVYFWLFKSVGLLVLLVHALASACICRVMLLIMITTLWPRATLICRSMIGLLTLQSRVDHTRHILYTYIRDIWRARNAELMMPLMLTVSCLSFIM